MNGHQLTTSAVSRSDLLDLQTSVSSFEDPTDWDQFVTHHFAPGIYVRQFDLVEGSIVVGKIHKHSHINVLLTGVVRVASEFHTETFAAPRIWQSEAGIKRAVYTLENAMWLTIHPNPSNEDDLEKIENEVIAPDYSALDTFLRERLESDI